MRVFGNIFAIQSSSLPFKFFACKFKFVSLEAACNTRAPKNRCSHGYSFNGSREIWGDLNMSGPVYLATYSHIPMTNPLYCVHCSKQNFLWLILKAKEQQNKKNPAFRGKQNTSLTLGNEFPISHHLHGLSFSKIWQFYYRDRLVSFHKYSLCVKNSDAVQGAWRCKPEEKMRRNLPHKYIQAHMWNSASFLFAMRCK